MMNINYLKSEVYKKEKKKIYIKSLLINFVVVVIISISLSGVAHNQREEGLMKENHLQKMRSDSLEHVLVTELKEMKKRENSIIRSALSLSDDTTFAEFNPKGIDIIRVVHEQSKRFNAIDDVVQNRWDSINSIPMGSPISNAELNRISDGFGWRKHPILRRWIFHEGTDFSAPSGSDVFSTSDGVVERVVKSKSKKGYGNRVVINHGYGYKTVYAHLKSYKVKKGQVVKRGDVIGYVGNTGLSTGPHLHYEVLVDNRPVNPQLYFYYGDQVAKK